MAPPGRDSGCKIDDRAADVGPANLPAAARVGSIEFRHVGFHYPTPADREPRWILRDLSFVVPAGATWA